MRPQKETLLALLRSQATDRRKVKEAASRLLKLDVHLSHKDVLEALRAVGRKSCWDVGLMLLGTVRDRKSSDDYLKDACYAAAIRACGTAGHLDQALHLLQERAEQAQEVSAGKQAVASLASLGATVAACANTGDWALALSLLREARNFKLQPDVAAYSAGITACRRGVQGRRALALLEELQADSLQPDVIACSAAISACEEGRMWAQALDLLSAMRRAELLPNVVSYSAAISACEKGQRWVRALMLLREMQGQELVPNAVSYSAAMRACTKSRKWALALDLWVELREEAQLKPSGVSCTAALGACAGGGCWEFALALLEQAWAGTQRGVAPDRVAYAAALSACERGREWTWALWTLTEMRRRQVQPDKVCGSIVKRARLAGGLGRKSRNAQRVQSYLTARLRKT